MTNNRNKLSIRHLFRPNKIIIILLLLFLLFSTVPPNYFSYTTKITWDEYHGKPLTILKLTGCYGPCGGGEISRRYVIQKFDTFSLLGNIFIWYLAASFLVNGISVLLRNEKNQAIINRKR